jgi:hypothetical protein
MRRLPTPECVKQKYRKVYEKETQRGPSAPLLEFEEVADT